MIIAFKTGLTVIPFENVRVVVEQDNESGSIDVYTEGVEGAVTFYGVHGKDFVNAYCTYLSVVEAMTGIESENKDDSKIESWGTETMGGGSDRTKKTT